MVTLDSYDNALVIDGWENGVAPDPYQGIADIRNANVTSVPGEASAGFKTESLTFASGGGNVTSTSAGNDTITITPPAGVSIQQGTAIIFNGLSGQGVTDSTPYWIKGDGNTFSISDNPRLSGTVDITGDGGTGTYSLIGMTKPVNRYALPSNFGKASYFIIDDSGHAWRDGRSSGVTSSKWVFQGNTTLTNANGNGIVAYKGYLFVFRNSLIDYMVLSTSAWTYGWNPSTGGSGTTGTFLNTTAGVTNTHYAYVGQDDVVYYCDGPFVGSFFQTEGATFDPTDATTVTWAKQALALPSYDMAISLAELGVNLLVGGILNLIYPWNRTTGTSYTYPIWVSENYIYRMVTVNTSTWILAGFRGNVYLTNGSQASLFAKIPDHISETIEPYLIWGDFAAQKNQLYLGVKATDNAGTAINQYGGVWGIDINTAAVRLVNKLSYGTYAGIATVLLSILPDNGSGPFIFPNSTGYGLHIGWDSGVTTYGMDQTIATPYSSSEVTIDSDLIPIGTYQKRRNNTRIEYKLTKPLVSGESITLSYRTDFSQSYTDIATDSTVGNYSNTYPVPWSNVQWLQVRATLNSTASSPSYVRLKQLRILL